MRHTQTISLTPLICALGVVAVLAMMPFFVSAASPTELPAACPGTLSDYNVIEGTSGDDELIGTDEPDYILGYEGDDVIDGAGGTDCIVAGPGLDEIRHPTGDIYFLGEAPENTDEPSSQTDDDSDEDATPARLSTACVTIGNVVPVGKKLTFAAGHYGGEGEVTYRWFGAISGEGQFQFPTFTTPGPKLITVVATDEQGRVATAGCPVLAQTGISVPTYTPSQPGGVGGAPSEPGTGGTQQPPALSGTGTPSSDTDEGAKAPEDLVDGEAVDITSQAGSNTGRIVLWVLIVLIIISLGVLFWQRYYQDGEDGTVEEEKRQKKTETKKDTDKKDMGGSQGNNDGSVIIPPAN